MNDAFIHTRRWIYIMTIGPHLCASIDVEVEHDLVLFPELVYSSRVLSVDD